MRALSAQGAAGFTLVEMIIVVFLLGVAMLGILAVFDASARINKSESEVADAQGNVRFSISRMASAIRMAGSGGLFITQAVLNHRDPQLAGITVVNGVDPNSYDNVQDGTTVTDLNGDTHFVRPGTDMIEIRGVINSAMVGFDQTAQNGCGTCTGVSPLTAKVLTGSPLTGEHVNEDAANRAQFERIDNDSAGAPAAPMFILVAQNDDLHNGCTAPSAQNPTPQPHYAQPTYNVGLITNKTQLATLQTFGNVNFGDATAQEFNNEFPAAAGTAAQPLTGWLRHAGIMDDIVYFVDNGVNGATSEHPVLAQGTRRGAAFDVVTLAEDVEDMQIAYGVDIDNPADNMIERKAATSLTDPDTNVSNQPGGDEWVPNVPADTVPVTGANFFTANDFVDAPGGPLSGHCPRLHGVMVSLVAKSKNSDPSWAGPMALGVRIMNSPVTINAPYPDTAQYPGRAGSDRFRRRVQTLKINLRNYAFEG